MEIIRMGVDPVIKAKERAKTWNITARHFECGTKVRLRIADLQASGYYNRKFFWICPVCSTKFIVRLWSWRIPRNMRCLIKGG